MQNSVTKEIAELAESVLAPTDFFLIDVQIKGGKVTEIWVSVDGEERGINMDECAEISRELSFLMDAHDVFSGKYRINVSSPGLSRPLTDRRQYPKNKGRKVKITYKVNGEQQQAEGTLEDVSDEHIVVARDDTAVTVPFTDLIETHIIPSFK